MSHLILPRVDKVLRLEVGFEAVVLLLRPLKRPVRGQLKVQSLGNYRYSVVSRGFKSTLLYVAQLFINIYAVTITRVKFTTVLNRVPGPRWSLRW